MLISLKTKIIGAIAILIGLLFLFKKKNKPSDKGVEEYNPIQYSARKVAIIIKSALNVDSGLWGWSEDEQAVINILNKNYEIQPLIAIEYKKLTKNILTEDLSKYLDSDELEQIKFNKI